MSLARPEKPLETLHLWRKLFFEGEIWSVIGKPEVLTEAQSCLKQWDDWIRWHKNEGTNIDFPQWDHQKLVAEALIDFAQNSSTKTEAQEYWKEQFGAGVEQDVIARLSGQPRKSLLSQQISVLLGAAENQTGWIATLEIDFLKDGTGEIYPDPFINTAFCYLDNFLTATRRVWNFFKRKHPELENLDIRFRLHPRQKKHRLTKREDYLWSVEGDSHQAAFYLCLEMLKNLYLNKPESLIFNSHFVVTGNLPEIHGDILTLGKVGKHFSKFKAIVAEDLEAVNSVIVSEADRTTAEDAWITIDSDKRRNISLKSFEDIEEIVQWLRSAVKGKVAVREFEFGRCEKLKWLGEEVDIAENFQLLPMLRTVHKKELLNLSPENGAIHLPTDNTYSITKIFSDFKMVVNSPDSSDSSLFINAPEIPRIIVLGEPGAGKSAICKYLAWGCQAQEEGKLVDEIGQSWFLKSSRRVTLIPVNIKLALWEIWAEKYAKYDLVDYLTEEVYSFSKIKTQLTHEDWLLYLNSGEVLLLFDGLDEISGSETFKENSLRFVLRNYKSCPMVITCRRMSFETYYNFFEGLPVFSLQGLTPRQQVAFIDSYSHQGKEYETSQLKQQLEKMSQIRTLARNPLLLSIICFVYSSDENKQLPIRKNLLYKRAVDALLDPETWSERNQKPTSAEVFTIKEKLRILSETAYRLWGSNENRRIIFSKDEFKDNLFAVLSEKFPQHSDCAIALLNEFSHSGGILHSDRKEKYSFLHPTFYEYLVAYSIANEKNRIDDLLKSNDIFKRDWSEILILLCGILAQEEEVLADSFIEKLEARKGDDLLYRPFITATLAAWESNSKKINKLLEKNIKYCFLELPNDDFDEELSKEALLNCQELTIPLMRKYVDNPTLDWHIKMEIELFLAKISPNEESGQSFKPKTESQEDIIEKIRSSPDFHLKKFLDNHDYRDRLTNQVAVTLWHINQTEAVPYILAFLNNQQINFDVKTRFAEAIRNEEAAVIFDKISEFVEYIGEPNGKKSLKNARNKLARYLGTPLSKSLKLE